MNGRHTTELRQMVRDALQRRGETVRQVNRSNGRLVRMAVGVAAGGIVLAIVLMLTGCVATPDYEAQERAREQARQLATLDTALAAVWRLVPLGAVLGVLGLGLRVGLAAARRYETERTPSADGTLPIRAEHLDTIAPAALASAHITRAAAASRPGVPHSIHYAPRTDTRTSATMARSDQVETDTQGSQLPSAVDLAALNWTPTITSILLGVGTRGPVSVRAADLCHVALVGATGSGKSATLRLLLPQLLAIGGRVLLIDPHYADLDPSSGDDWRPIRQRLHTAPAVTPGEIDEALAYLTDELDRRMELRRNGQKVGAPLWTAIDELPIIADTVPAAMPRLTRILREGRKVGLLAIGASQSMLIKTLGGDATVRDAYRTCYYAGGDQRSGSALLDVPSRDIPEGMLGKGVVMLRSASTAPAELVRVPLVSNSQLPLLFRRPRREADAEADTEAGGVNPLPQHPDAAVRADRLQPLDAASKRILERFREGASIRELTIDAAGGATGGRAYQDAAERVADVLRGAVRIDT